MDKLRVDSGIKKIEVNDNGEYICIPISDTSFYQKFGSLLNSFEEKQTEVSKKADDLSRKHRDNPDNDTGAAIDVIDLYSEVCRYVCGELDKLFGEGCCRKVFAGAEVPGLELIEDFFEQITPLIQQYADERNEKIRLMYNRNRKSTRRK